QLLGELAHSTPELLAKLAGEHGYQFSPDELSQLIEDRAQRSLQGETFWGMVLGQVPLSRPHGKVPFGQIKGPSWVNQAPYRKALPSTSEETVTSLSDLYSEIESEVR